MEDGRTHDVERRASATISRSSRSTRTVNPLFPASNKNYPVDRNNFAPRIGLTHALDSSGKTVLRGGYGLFYNRTVLGSIDDTMEQGKLISFATVNFPNDNADPGPAAGRFPTDPLPGQRPLRQHDAAEAAVSARRAAEE